MNIGGQGDNCSYDMHGQQGNIIVGGSNNTVNRSDGGAGNRPLKEKNVTFNFKSGRDMHQTGTANIVGGHNHVTVDLGAGKRSPGAEWKPEQKPKQVRLTASIEKFISEAVQVEDLEHINVDSLRAVLEKRGVTGIPTSKPDMIEMLLRSNKEQLKINPRTEKFIRDAETEEELESVDETALRAALLKRGIKATSESKEEIIYLLLQNNKELQKQQKL